MNIFVVEDERWALAELAELLTCYEPEHRVYAFENGDDALSAVATVHPHLVLTDINMPGIDGLELIEQLYKLDPTIKCMILSVHDQFEYARQGIQFGVGDYLLKPVKKEVLFQAIDKAILHIEKESKQKEEWMHGSLAQQLLADDAIPESIVLREMNGRAYCIVLIALEKKAQLKSWKDTSICFEELKKQVAQSPFPESLIHCVDLDCRQRVLLIPLAATAQIAGIQMKLSVFYQKLQKLPAPVHMGFAVKAEKETLNGAFSRLKLCLEEQMTFGMSTFLPPGLNDRTAELGSVWEKVRVMEFHYKKGDTLKGYSALQQILTELRHKEITKRQLRLFIQDMLFSLKYKWLASKQEILSLNDVQEDLRSLSFITDYEELLEWLSEKMLHLYCQEPKDLNLKGLVPVLLQQIHDHYPSNISLQQFAAEHHVSLGYFSRIFKSQTGTTFSDYLAGYRIRKAKELLSGGIERLQEVSRMVGYEDTKHFSALFKKIVGETPIKYAKKHSVNK